VDFKLSAEQEILRQVAREFAETRVAPLVPIMEKEGKWPDELGPAMGEAGFLGVTIPERYGGSGLGHLARMLILEEVGTVSAAVAMALQVFVLGIDPSSTPAARSRRSAFFRLSRRAGVWLRSR